MAYKVLLLPTYNSFTLTPEVHTFRTLSRKQYPSLTPMSGKSGGEYEGRTLRSSAKAWLFVRRTNVRSGSEQGRSWSSAEPLTSPRSAEGTGERSGHGPVKTPLLMTKLWNSLVGCFSMSWLRILLLLRILYLKGSNRTWILNNSISLLWNTHQVWHGNNLLICLKKCL